MAKRSCSIKRRMGTDNVYVVIDNITFKLSFLTFRLFMEDGINVLQSFLAEKHKPNT